jgi:hypothetical protein
MNRFHVWIPGRFSLTNAMLSNLRAAEKYRGKRPRNWRDAFAEETQAIRLAAKRAISKVVQEESGPIGLEPDEVCSLRFGVIGHGRHDPDAWYLLAKAVVDGFCDSGLLWPDRKSVWVTGGRVLQSVVEEFWWVRYTCGSAVRVPAVPGVMVAVDTFERPVPRG